MFFLSQFIIFSLTACIFAQSPNNATLIFTNYRPDTVWVGTLSSVGSLMNDGGWQMTASNVTTVTLPFNFIGIVWVRTQCDNKTCICQTGPCAPQIPCNGTGGVPPMTILQLNIQQPPATSAHIVSLVDGFNIPITIEPLNAPGCPIGGCNTDLNTNCPADLQKTIQGGSQVIACNSNCNINNSAQYCCNSPNVNCDPQGWPTNVNNSANYFSSNCPNAISYAQDSRDIPSTCNSATTYLINIGVVPSLTNQMPAIITNTAAVAVEVAYSPNVPNVTFELINNMNVPLWIGVLTTVVPPVSSNGWELDPGETIFVTVQRNQGGRVWGRTLCVVNNETCSCQTGDCGGKLDCSITGGAAPATLFEFYLPDGGLDFYDVSLVDGYNLPMAVTLEGGSGTDGNYSCQPANCTADINAICPPDLIVLDKTNVTTIACKSACTATGNPQDCCTGSSSTSATCNPASFTGNSTYLFKKNCPSAYSFAYDDNSSTFTCENVLKYIITFDFT